MTKHPAEIDSEVTIEELIEADHATHDLIERHREQIASCEDCTDEDPCDEHYMDEAQMLLSARVYRNMQIYGDRIHFDLERGGVNPNPPIHTGGRREDSGRV